VKQGTEHCCRLKIKGELRCSPAPVVVKKERVLVIAVVEGNLPEARAGDRRVILPATIVARLAISRLTAGPKVVIRLEKAHTRNLQRKVELRRMGLERKMSQQML